MNQLRKLKDEASEAHAQWGSIRGQRSERERELQGYCQLKRNSG